MPVAQYGAATARSRDDFSSCLDPTIRRLMEQRLGRELGEVRVLTNQPANPAAMGAEAYACGETIVLGGELDVAAQRGLWLLAHELAHVVQQRNGRHIDGLTSASANALEATASEVADIVASGRSIPPDFDFGAAPYGMVQCHAGEECPGTRYDAKEKAIWMAANDAIEQAYKNDHQNHAMFFGSDFEDSLLKIGPEGPRAVPSRTPWREGPAEVRLPRGAPNKAFGDLLLGELRGLERQRRPDIIDFTDRIFYEIKSTGFEDKGQVQLQSYYKITEALLTQHGPSRPWKTDSAALWYPKHVLPMVSPDPRVELVVCTQATDHGRYPGMILYEVRRTRRRRGRQKTSDARMYDYWNEYDTFRRALESQLAPGIPEFDPSSPEYVIIVPHEFFQDPAIRRLTRDIMEPKWEKLRVQPEIARRRLIVDPRVTQFWLAMVAIVGAVAIVVVSAGALAGVGAAAGVGAGAVAVETTAATAATTAGIQSTIIVPSSIAAQVAGTTIAATATTAEAISLATFNAMLASSAVKATVATAGVLLVIGTAKTAEASTGKVDLDSVIPFRAVPVNDFTEQEGGALYADSSGDVPDNFYTDKQITEKFAVGVPLYYDNKKHWIFGRVSVR